MPLGLTAAQYLNKIVSSSSNNSNSSNLYNSVTLKLVLKSKWTFFSPNWLILKQISIEIVHLQPLICAFGILFQGGRFMSTAMYDAREALIPGSAYDRSNTVLNMAETTRLVLTHCLENQ